ncbi:MAG: metallophosphoesterase [Myxococcales bacterium FL481]|nr:MAG: metallophosphoesterase [Myxococcales bacterium FL481]
MLDAPMLPSFLARLRDLGSAPRRAHPEPRGPRLVVGWGLTVVGVHGLLRLVLPAAETPNGSPTEARGNAERRHALADPAQSATARPVPHAGDPTAASPDVPPHERTRSGMPTLQPGSSLLALLPDTQFYSYRHAEVFIDQTRWLATHASALDIRFVVHLGDIVHRNSLPEWRRAALALSRLEGAVPFAVVPGNHDYGPFGNARTRETGLNAVLSFARHAGRPSFGGAFESGRLDNSYHLVEASGHAFIVLALEWGPRNQVIDWANDVMQRHPDRRGILVTHAYLYRDGRRYDHTHPEWNQANNPHQYGTEGGVNDGEQLWQKLVRHHDFVMTVNGHVTGTGTGYLVSTTDTGTRCHQMLSNYQMRDRGGEGYLRLLELDADGSTVTVHTYSPWLNRQIVEPNQQFQFTIEPPAN